MDGEVESGQGGEGEPPETPALMDTITLVAEIDKLIAAAGVKKFAFVFSPVDAGPNKAYISNGSNSDFLREVANFMMQVGQEKRKKEQPIESKKIIIFPASTTLH